METPPQKRPSNLALRWIVGALGLVALFAVAPRVYRQVLVQAVAQKSFERAKQIAQACKTWADDHGGQFPPSLEALAAATAGSSFVLASPFAPQEAVGYTYRPGLTVASGAKEILLEDKFVPAAGRNVSVRADLTGGVLRVAVPSGS